MCQGQTVEAAAANEYFSAKGDAGDFPKAPRLSQQEGLVFIVSS